MEGAFMIYQVNETARQNIENNPMLLEVNKKRIAGEKLNEEEEEFLHLMSVSYVQRLRGQEDGTLLAPDGNGGMYEIPADVINNLIKQGHLQELGYFVPTKITPEQLKTVVNDVSLHKIK